MTDLINALRARRDPLSDQAADALSKLTIERDATEVVLRATSDGLTKAEAERDALTPTCCICGAKESCGSDACSFDPTPRALYDDNCRLQRELDAAVLFIRVCGDELGAKGDRTVIIAALRMLIAEHDELAATLERLRKSLTVMEEGYRRRCNYCNGNLIVCDECPAGGCQAPTARRAIDAALQEG